MCETKVQQIFYAIICHQNFVITFIIQIIFVFTIIVTAYKICPLITLRFIFFSCNVVFLFLNWQRKRVCSDVWLKVCIWFVCLFTFIPWMIICISMYAILPFFCMWQHGIICLLEINIIIIIISSSLCPWTWMFSVL